MGAIAIRYEVPVDKYERPYDAYRALVEEEQYNCGHDPYSGTIATCEYKGKCEKPETSDEYELLLDDIRKRECYYYIDGNKYVFIGWAAC